MLAADQFIHAFGECDFAEYGRPVIRGETVLSALGALAFLDETDVNELVEMIMKGTVVDGHRRFEFCGTHRPTVDEPVADLVSGTVSIGSVHCKVLIETENAVCRQEIRWILRSVLTDCTRLLDCCPDSGYERTAFGLYRTENSRKQHLLFVYSTRIPILYELTFNLGLDSDYELFAWPVDTDAVEESEAGDQWSLARRSRLAHFASLAHHVGTAWADAHGVHPGRGEHTDVLFGDELATIQTVGHKRAGWRSILCSIA